ncbi:MAG: alpha-ribazole phosphatase [Pseudomonadota bacterium]
MGLILLRHTTPLIETGVCYGQLDLDIAESFTEEADETAKMLPPFEQIFSSPLKRCRYLAEYIGERTGHSVRYDCRLSEMDFGSWEGRPWSDIPRLEIDLWAKDFLHARAHGGESVNMLRQRTLEVVGELKDIKQQTLVVTHAGVIRAVLSTGDTADHFRTDIGFGKFIVIE